MASFTPNKQDCQHAINNTEVTSEFIFIVDCSGSMKDENKIEFARQAILLFLKSIPVYCHFNIIRFGSRYQTLFKDITAVYNEPNSRQAEQLINSMQADFGGTELVNLIILHFINIRFCLVVTSSSMAWRTSNRRRSCSSNISSYRWKNIKC
jgi:hypothetical protein